VFAAPSGRLVRDAPKKSEDDANAEITKTGAILKIDCELRLERWRWPSIGWSRASEPGDCALRKDRAMTRSTSAVLAPATATVAAVCACVCAWTASAGGQVLTRQYSSARTGATLTETTLTPANVNASTFGKIFSFAVDGDVYAQPLYVPRVDIPGKGVHDVVYVATEHDSVYAFDAAGQPAEPLWRLSFLNESAGVTTVSSRDTSCPFIAPEVGITPTPVIDRQTGTLYVLARTKESQGLLRGSTFVQKLHALAITTGAEKSGGPVEIHAAGFDPLRELPRAALLLANGQVYLTWASSCDVGEYHGWVMAYDARTLAQTATFNTSPDAQASGIWQSDNGPAVDASGHVYAVTGNGKYDVDQLGRDYGDSALKLRLSNNQLVVADHFTPANQALLNNTDRDFGSGGPVVIPDGPTADEHLLIVGGKDGVVYALNRDRMHPSVQSFKLAGGIYASPAYWNGHLFFLASEDRLKDYAVTNGRLSDAPVHVGAKTFGNPGATPAISANGARDGIVWLLQTKVWNAYSSQQPSVLYAFDAANVAREIYNSEQNPERDRAGQTVRFTIPTIANGRVYVPAKREITVYGLLPAKRGP
jgi:hypothetical protein